MAPNLHLTRPLQETLIRPFSVRRDEDGHGTHRVVSTYAKLQEGETSQEEQPINKVTPLPANQEQHDQQQAIQKEQQLLTEVLLRSQQQGQGEQKQDQQIQRHRQQSPKTGKMFMQTSPSLLGEMSVEDILGDDSKERLPDALEALSILRDGLANPVSLRDIFLSRDLTAGLSNHNRDVYELRLSQPGASAHQTFSTQFKPSVPDFKPSLLASESVGSPLATTYRPYQKLSTSDMNPLLSREEQLSDRSLTMKDLPSRSTMKTATSEAPSFVVREILIEEETRRGVGERNVKEELADFSNLFHHEKSLDDLAKGGRDIAVQEEWLFTSEGSMAVILIGMCSLIMMLICFIFLLKKWRGQTNSKGKKDYIEEEKSDFHKSHFDTDFHIPGFAYLPFIHSLIHHHSPQKMDPHSPPIIDVEGEMSKAQIGRIWFSVRYDDEKSDLHINILHARYPNSRGATRNTGELWVEAVILSPMNTVKATSKTSNERATSSPVFNHRFIFLLQKEEVKSYILKLTLHDNHPKNGEETVGSIILPFSSIDLNSNEIYCRYLL